MSFGHLNFWDMENMNNNQDPSGKFIINTVNQRYQ